MAVARQNVRGETLPHAKERPRADDGEGIIVHKNRARALWALALIAFMLPLSAWVLSLGLQAGRFESAWLLFAFGVLGLAAFSGGAVVVIRNLLAPWHLALYPSHLAVHAPAYRLDVPWEQIAGIAVDVVARRLGCVLVFEDPAAVAAGATFFPVRRRTDAVHDAASMRARMEHNYENWGYHYGFPGQILELGPEELAELLSRARTGALWQRAEEVTS